MQGSSNGTLGYTSGHTGTYAVMIEYAGSGTANLSTANVVGQLFLAGVTAGLVAGNFS